MNQDNFSDDLKPSKDDIALRQRQLNTKRKASVSTEVSSSGSNGFIIIAFLIALVAVGIAGFAFWKLMIMEDKLVQADDFLSKLNSTTANLQESVSETGAKASLSTGALKSLVKENNSEIRKLWYVSNERNKKNIATNKKQNAALKKEIAALTQTVSKLEIALSDAQGALSQKLEGQQKAFNRIQKQVNSLQKNLEALPEIELRIGQNEELLQNLESQLKSLNKQIKQQKLANPDSR